MLNSTPQPNQRWPRRAVFTVGWLIMFFFGYAQGEYGATQKIADAASRATPRAIAAMRVACPQDDVSILSAECIDLIPLLSMTGDHK